METSQIDSEIVELKKRVTKLEKIVKELDARTQGDVMIGGAHF